MVMFFCRLHAYTAQQRADLNLEIKNTLDLPIIGVNKCDSF